MKNRNQRVRDSIGQSFGILLEDRLLDIALTIRAVMKERDVTVSDIAERLDVSGSNVSRWLRGDQNLSVKTIFLLSDALEVPFRILLGSAEATATGTDVKNGTL